MKKCWPLFLCPFLLAFLWLDNVPFIKINGKKQFYTIKGEGRPAIVFLTGMGVPMQEMGALQERIAQITKTFAYDRAGIGRSEALEAERSIPNLCAELKELLEKTYFTKNFILVAHSRGAVLARYMAAKYPEKVLGMILIDPALPEIKWQQKNLRNAEEKTKADSAFAANYTNNPSLPATVKQEMKFYPKADSAIVSMLPLPKKIPITLIASTQVSDDKYSEADIEIKVAYLKKLVKEAPQTKLVFTSKSGHFIYEDEPGLVTNEIASMIRAFK